MTTIGDMLEVGRERGSNAAFIAVPSSRYDTAKGPLSGTQKHIVIIEDNEIEWLIEALAKEIGPDRARGVALTLQKT